MPEPAETPKLAALRLLPSVDELLRTPEAIEIAAFAGAKRALAFARDACETLRERIIDGRAISDFNKASLLHEAATLMSLMDRASSRVGLRRVINTTGVIIHTNLGRSRLSEDARRAIADAAGYCGLEYDLESGKRGRRGEAAGNSLCELTGAEAGIIVNNCAAAAFLVLTAFAKGKEVIVSRGELVEIGGDFRVPDVMEQSGAVMREVGTTNRTKLRDYETAISGETAMFMRVHPSNYRIVGFTEAPELEHLATLAKSAGVILFEDAGSGALTDLSEFGLGDEPHIAKSIADGADIVAFSGDKLLGGPQAGIVVGKRELIEKLRRHPLYRALRVDKITYAAMEATLESYLKGREFQEIPTLRMLAASLGEIRGRAEASIEIIRRLNTNLRLGLVDGESVIGGGSAPNIKLRTVLISVCKDGLSPEEIEVKLRAGDPPVIARIAGDMVLIDLRTVDPDEEAELSDALASL